MERGGGRRVCPPALGQCTQCGRQDVWQRACSPAMLRLAKQVVKHSPQRQAAAPTSERSQRVRYGVESVVLAAVLGIKEPRDEQKPGPNAEVRPQAHGAGARGVGDEGAQVIL